MFIEPEIRTELSQLQRSEINQLLRSSGASEFFGSSRFYKYFVPPGLKTEQRFVTKNFRVST